MENQSLTDKGGRPAHFETPGELQAAIDKYLKEAKPPTISGLAYALGFESRQSFYDYEKREGFSYTIKKARLFMESHYEGKLQGNNPAGSIFWLKNAGWSDKQEIDQKTEHSGSIAINWEEPPIQHTSNQGSNGELQGIQRGLQDNS